MKLPILKILLITLVFNSCKKDFTSQNDLVQLSEPLQEKELNSNKGYKYFEFHDEKLNMPSSRVMLPKNWKRSNSKEILFDGPDNMNISYSQMSVMHAYTEDPNMAYTYRSYGKKNEYPLTTEQIIEQDFVTIGKQNGLVLTNTFDLPKLRKNLKNFLILILRLRLHKIMLSAKVWSGVILTVKHI